MADFVRKLPAPRAAPDNSFGSFSAISSTPSTSTSLVQARCSAPRYGRRKGWVPRGLHDYGDGGAYPEIICAQYPLDMGRKKQSVSKVVPLQTDADGKVAWDAVLKQGASANKLAVYTRPEDQKEKWTEDMERPSEELDAINTERTKAAIEALMLKKSSAGKPAKNGGVSAEPTYVRYTPNQQAPGHNAGCQQRIIRVVGRQVDPLEPPKFRHKKVPRGPGTPPPPVHHSPARKLTAQDQKDWKIPPCVSNWKNAKGYTIPLDKRLAADGRGYQDVTINDKFAMLSEDLYIAERKAREEIKIRNDLAKQKKVREEEIREGQLREMAAAAREKKRELAASGEHKEDVAQRAATLKEREREIQRDTRLEAAGRGRKRDREADRDISERVALGQAAQPSSQEALFDQRLFNQSAGMDSGYKGGDDESYNVYDKALFADRTKAGIYKHDKERMAQTEGKLASIGTKTLGGAEGKGSRTAPVEFEEDNPFGLDDFYDAVKKK